VEDVMVYLLFALGAGAIAYFLVIRRGPSAVSLANKAAESGSVEELVKAAATLPYKRRSMFFQAAIAWLWNNWQRPLAAELSVHFAKQHGAEKITQFWVRQVMEVEPLTAQKTFDKRFLEQYYRPEVAKQCGLTKS
jgi:hypothetical protein